jgi:hypothetical protein
VAMASFTMPFTTDKAMNMVFAAVNEGWQEGKANLVVKELMKKYRPLDTVSKIEMRQQLSKIKMKKGMDPSLLFERLTSIQNQYLGPGKRLDKEELIAIILDVATEKYRAILTIERKIKGDFLTIEDLERVMTEEYRQNTRKQQHTSSDEGEMLLFQSQVTCFKCGKSGHCANECTSRRVNNANSKNYRKFQGKCGTCGFHGHTTKDCWTREENKSKRLPNQKKHSEEKMNISVEKKRSSEKVVGYCWAIKDLETMLTYPDLWIADTGSTVHSTENIAYANNWEPDTSNTVVVMGNGKKEKFTKIGKVEGIAKDKDGINQGNIILLDVMFLPNGKYNLISVTKVMENGWKLEGDSNHIKLKKDKKEFVFNIKINTSRGILFSVRIKNKKEMVAAIEDQGNTITATKKVDINDAHMLFGHLSENMMTTTAKRLGWCLTGEKRKCIHCAIGKGIQTKCQQSQQSHSVKRNWRKNVFGFGCSNAK